MVRLKADTGRAVKRAIEFQFQYGAIKSGTGDRVLNIKKKISIPVWCD